MPGFRLVNSFSRLGGPKLLTQTIDFRLDMLVFNESYLHEEFEYVRIILIQGSHDISKIIMLIKITLMQLPAQTTYTSHARYSVQRLEGLPTQATDVVGFCKGLIPHYCIISRHALIKESKVNSPGFSRSPSQMLGDCVYLRQRFSTELFLAGGNKLLHEFCVGKLRMALKLVRSTG